MTTKELGVGLISVDWMDKLQGPNQGYTTVLGNPGWATTPRSSLVVALGAVEPALVEPVVAGHARFVAAPTDHDLAAAEDAIVRADALVDRAMLDRIPRMRVLARTGVGVGRVDRPASSARSTRTSLNWRWPGSSCPDRTAGPAHHPRRLTPDPTRPDDQGPRNPDPARPPGRRRTHPRTSATEIRAHRPDAGGSSSTVLRVRVRSTSLP